MMRRKMSNQQRAKQFAPFAALKGYEEAIKQKERIICDKVTLSEDDKNELNWQLKELNKNDIVEVVYYNDGEYIQINGMVSKIDYQHQVIQIVNTPISFSNLLKLAKEEVKEV